MIFFRIEKTFYPIKFNIIEIQHFDRTLKNKLIIHHPRKYFGTEIAKEWA